jgi:hypothetical protein
MVISNTIGYIREGYGGYATIDVGVFGWGCLLVCIIVTIILTAMKGKEGYADLSKHKEGR